MVHTFLCKLGTLIVFTSQYTYHFLYKIYISCYVIPLYSTINLNFNIVYYVEAKYNSCHWSGSASR